MTRIRVMPSELALKVAAGEVIERPAAAVKELVDNALDAGARRIRIEIRGGGLDLIRVSDDGSGIERDDLPLAFSSHATSKIASLDDLESLSTLGFRGEALPSVSAVARVDVLTRTAQEQTGSRFQIEFGEVVRRGGDAAPVGLSISVRDLFGNVPARRKFVRSARAETMQIQQVVMRYALARPEVLLLLEMDGREAYTSPATGDIADVLASIHSPASGQLVPVDWQDDGIAVTGVISKPGLIRANRSAINFFANGRPIENRSLTFALEAAYSGFLMAGQHPLAAIHLRLDPSEIDANIHPTKSEVRFVRDRAVHGAINRAASDGLLDLRLQARRLQPLEESVSGDTVGPSPIPLPTGPIAEPLMPDVPALRVFGQTNQTFIIAEGPQGLYMIDQHAAHERILYDRFDGQLDAGSIPCQPLLEPVALELEPDGLEALDRNRDLLAQSGFELEPFGAGSCLIRGTPMTARSSPSELVREVLTELAALRDPAASRERALAAIACRSAVKAGQTLDVQEMREIVTQLERTTRPSTCPHGRPTMIHLSHSQLEREFGRR
ncbi:MAG: DNA mismatch repair endonuclease MutL [Chloroflexota bacterium]